MISEESTPRWRLKNTCSLDRKRSNIFCFHIVLEYENKFKIQERRIFVIRFCFSCFSFYKLQKVFSPRQGSNDHTLPADPCNKSIYRLLWWKLELRFVHLTNKQIFKIFIFNVRYFSCIRCFLFWETENQGKCWYMI